MNIFGWALFGLGSLLLFISAFVGTEVGLGIGPMANLPGTITGSAMMISGAVFIACSKVVDALQGQSVLSPKFSGKELEIHDRNAQTAQQKTQKNKEKDDEKHLAIILTLSMLIAGVIFAIFKP